MQLYVIQRRNNFRDAEDLQAAAARSAAEGDKTGSGVRWIRSYVVQEETGELGTFCIYEGDSPEAIRAHAAASVTATGSGRTTTVSSTGTTSSAAITEAAAWARIASGLSPS